MCIDVTSQAGVALDESDIGCWSVASLQHAPHRSNTNASSSAAADPHGYCSLKPQSGTSPASSSTAANLQPSTSSGVHLPKSAVKRSAESTRTSYFSMTEKGKRKKVDDVRCELTAIVEAKRNLTENQLTLLQAKEQREIEWHSVMMEEKRLNIEEKRLDIKIKTIKLELLQRQLNEQLNG